MKMKKTMIILSALLALAACNKETLQEESTIDASKLVFNIQVEKSDEPATKGVKTAWETGDVVYLFFEGNTTQYVQMTYDGTSWAYADKDGGTAYTGLSLTATGKKVSAVYIPGFVRGEEAPTYIINTYKWVIGRNLGGYILSSEKVPYTVTVGDVTTLDATLNMAAPANLVQIFVKESDPDFGNEYVLNMTNVKPFSYDGVVAADGTVVVNEGTTTFPMIGYKGTMGTETGYYFWGILADATLGSTNYNFQLVERSAQKKYAVSSKSKTVSGKNISGPQALKLTGLESNGNFVSLGYEGCPLWATGNLGRKNLNPLSSSNGTIVDPLAAGDYFQWGATVIYDTTNHNDQYTGVDYDSNGNLKTEYDVVYKVNNSWRMPTHDQMWALKTNTNAMSSYKTECWKTKWTGVGTDAGGALLTSNSNGISIFLIAVGYYSEEGELGVYEGGLGYYWTCTPETINPEFNTAGKAIEFETTGYVAQNSKRVLGLQIRPVKN